MDGGRVVLAADVVLGLALAAAVVAVLYRFIAFCLADLDRAAAVQGLPRETWRLLIMIMIPLGGLLYLRYGRVR
ncbi:MAG: hypothetical protein V7637_2522 [Mycobacteriales bacterium]